MKCSREPGGRKLCAGYVHSLLRTEREDVTCSSPQLGCSTASKKPHLRLYNLLRLFSRSIPVHTTNRFMHYYRLRSENNHSFVRSLLLQFILYIILFFPGYFFLVIYSTNDSIDSIFMKFFKNRYFVSSTIIKIVKIIFLK